MHLPLRSRAVGAVLGAVTISAGIVAFSTSSPLAKTTLHLLDGSALVADNHNGAYVHVNGATGTPDLKATINGATGKKMKIVQRGNRSYAEVTDDNGKVVVYPIDPDTLSPEQAKPAGHAHIISGGDSSYFIDDAAGTALRVNPDTLAAIGPKHKFAAPISAVVADDGSLLVLEVGEGKAIVVVGTVEGNPTRVGTPDQVSATVVGGNPVVLDRASGRAYVFRHHQIDRTITLGAAGDDLAVTNYIETNELVVLDRGNGNLISADIDSGAVKRTSVLVAAPQQVQAPLVTKDATYLVDARTGSVWVVSANGHVEKADDPGIGRGEHNFDAFVNQGYLYVNNPNSSLGAVVYADGSIHKFHKYDPKIPSTDKHHDHPVTPAQTPTPTIVLPKPGNGNGNNKPAPPQSQGTPPTKVVNRPGNPGPVTAEAGNGSVALSWGAADDGGSTQLQYRITCRPDCGTGTPSTMVPGASTSQTIDHLVNGHEYVFNVTATNEIGSSAPVQSNPATPTGTAVDAPSNVAARANADGTITVGWDWTKDNAQGLTVTGFRVTGTQKIPGSPSTQQSQPVRADATSATFAAHAFQYDPDEVGDTTFVVAAVVGKAHGPESEVSPSVDPFETPAAVTGLTQTGVGDGALNFTWTDDPPTGRAITYYVEGGPAPLTTSTPSINVTGLTNGTQYTFTVYAKNSSGQRSVRPDATLVGSSHTAPTISAATGNATGYTTATVTITVDFHGTGPGTCAVNGASQSCDTGTTQIGLSGLTDGTPYNLTASATNSQGDAAATAAVSFTTPHKPRVTVGRGVAASGCTNVGSPCYWATVHLDYFTPNQTVTFQCYDSGGAFAMRAQSITIGGGGTGDAAPPRDCFYGFGNRQMWVIVSSPKDGSVTSNTFTWPSR